MTTARQATLDDLPAILAMGQVMHEESRYTKHARDMMKIEQMVRRLIGLASGIVLVTDNGFLLGGIADYWFGHAKYGFQYVLYVDPAFRGSSQAGALVRAYVQAAKQAGATEVHIENSTGVETENVERFFARQGFTRVGGNFIMEL